MRLAWWFFGIVLVLPALTWADQEVFYVGKSGSLINAIGRHAEEKVREANPGIKDTELSKSKPYVWPFVDSQNYQEKVDALGQSDRDLTKARARIARLKEKEGRISKKIRTLKAGTRTLASSRAWWKGSAVTAICIGIAATAGFVWLLLTHLNLRVETEDAKRKLREVTKSRDWLLNEYREIDSRCQQFAAKVVRGKSRNPEQEWERVLRDARAEAAEVIPMPAKKA